MTREDIQDKTIEELRALCLKLNIKAHPRAGAETLIGKILQQPKAFKAAALDDQPVSDDPTVVPFLTEQEVMDGVAAYASKDGFEVKFPGDGTWIFKCKGAEDSGSLSMPLRVIKIKAEVVSRGRRAIRGHRDFDQTNAQGRNAYTNTVLA